MTEHSLDPAVIEALPSGCEILAVGEHGTSSWSRGYKIETEIDGEDQDYFLKVIQRARHAELALGEFESQKALWQHIPDNVVVPIAHGTFRSDDSKSFFLTSFHHLQEGKIPDAPELADLLKTLHTSAASPTGKFGFHVTTFNGYVPLVNDWCDTWEEWFSRQLRFDIEYEQSVRGADADFMAVADEFFAKVIPRLLRPLETGGRSIQPTLIHGDLWHGNTGIINDSTNKVVLFDSCCCYAHHEMELSMMRESRYHFSAQKYPDDYVKAMGRSAPAEDFDDRNILYSMHDNIINSTLHNHRTYLRQQVKEEMESLLKKYPNGIDDFIDDGTSAAVEDSYDEDKDDTGDVTLEDVPEEPHQLVKAETDSATIQADAKPEGRNNGTTTCVVLAEA